VGKDTQFGTGGSGGGNYETGNGLDGAFYTGSKTRRGYR
jgi:hypothetical protein